MDNTKDPVRVLREALEQIAVRMPDSIMSRIANDALAMTAAIPHSEQRETVAAGDLRFSFELAARKGFDHTMRGIDFQRDEDGNYRWAVTRNLYEFWKTACGIRANLAPVAAPAPEAELNPYIVQVADDPATEANAEQAQQRCVKAGGHCNCNPHERSKCPSRPPVPEAKAEELGYEVFFNGEWKPASAQAYFCMSEKNRRLAAPAVSPSLHSVKHEASELPPLPRAAYVEPLHIDSDLELFTEEQMYEFARMCIKNDRAALAAPPIAVQGSIGDDVRFRVHVSAVVCEHVAGHDIEPPMARLAAYIDSRSPVAAAPDMSLRNEDGKPRLAEWRRDAMRWQMLERGISSRLPGPAHGTRLRVISVSPTYGDETEVQNLRAVIDAALSAAAPSADAKGEAS